MDADERAPLPQPAAVSKARAMPGPTVRLLEDSAEPLSGVQR